MKNKLLILMLASIISACGGGGGGSTTPSSNGSATTNNTTTSQSYSLAKLLSQTLGTVYSSQLSGSDTNGVKYTGSISLANRAQVMLNGVLVTPRDLILNLSGTTSITVTAKSFVDSSNNLISINIQPNNITCTPSSPDSLPSSVKVGDFGILSTLVCSDNTTQSRSWRTEAAGNGNINIISNATVKDQFSTVTTVTDVTYTLDTSGNILKFKTVTTLQSNGFTLTYSSI